MGLFHYLWNRTAASNATADSGVNWAEGMAPSAVNDSARAMMASAAGFRDDIAGAIVTGGTSTAYTVTSYQIFDTLAHMDKMVIAFTPHTTSGGTATLNVDGLGAKPLRSATGVEIPSGTLIAGTPYTCLYNNSDAAFYLHNFFANPYSVPLGGMLDYTCPAVPNSAFVFPIGQQISQTTYAALYALYGSNRYGTDGGGLFYLPDLTGRVTAMKEASATRLTSTYFGGNSTALGAVGGLESSTLVTSNLPAYTPTGTITNGALVAGAAGGATGSLGGSANAVAVGTDNQSAGFAFGKLGITQNASSFAGTAQGGTSTPVRTVMPAIIVNKILRVL